MIVLANALRWFTVMAAFALDGTTLALLLQSRRLFNEPPRTFARVYFVSTVVLLAYVQETAYERLDAPLAVRTVFGFLGVTLQVLALLGLWLHYKQGEAAQLAVSARERHRRSVHHRNSGGGRSSGPEGSA